MARTTYSQILGGMMVLSCVLSAPSFLSGAHAAYATGIQIDSFLIGIGAMALSLLGWLVTSAAGIALVLRHRHSIILVCAALVTFLVAGGPLFLPFVGRLVPTGMIAFAVVNVIVACVAVALVRREGKSDGRLAA